MSETEETELEKLEKFNPTDYSFEIRIKFETLKQLKRIADQLERWSYNCTLEVTTNRKERY